MKITITYAELSALVYKKTGKRLEFSFAGYNTLKVSKEIAVTFFTASPSLNVTFNNVESNHIYLSLTKTLMGLSKIVDNAIPSILEKIPSVTMHDDQFDVDLNGIQKLKAMLEMMILTGISFQNNCVELSFEFRS